MNAPIPAEVRDAEESELDELATVWYLAWQDGHKSVVPAELTRRRTRERFRDRLKAALAEVRVVGPVGAPIGFSMLKGDELYQLFVSARARGSGVAAALIADAEARLAVRGVETAWLTCAIGNDRAARFYEKCGWHRSGTVVEELDTPEGTMRLEVWRYEKHLRQLRNDQ
jgi:GNAT superfamily N-acetyltransferase